MDASIQTFHSLLPFRQQKHYTGRHTYMPGTVCVRVVTVSLYQGKYAYTNEGHYYPGDKAQQVLLSRIALLPGDTAHNLVKKNHKIIYYQYINVLIPNRIFYLLSTSSSVEMRYLDIYIYIYVICQKLLILYPRYDHNANSSSYRYNVRPESMCLPFYAHR